jgi:hypothetical protein
VQNHALQRHHDLVGAEAEEPAMGDNDVELLSLRVLEDALDGAELLALIVLHLTAFQLGNGDLLLLRRADGAGRLRLLADAECVASFTLLRLLLLTRLLLGLLLLHLLLPRLLLPFRHPLDPNLRLTLLLLELDLRLAGALERHLRLGLLRANHGFRLLGLNLRLGLLDLNLRLGLRDGYLRLRHAHDDLGLGLLHDDGRRSLADDDLRRLLLDVDLRRLLLNPYLSPGRLLLSLSLLLLARLLTCLRLLLSTDLDRLLILDRLELGLLLFAEGLRTLELAVLHALGNQLVTLHVHAVQREKNLALVLQHLDHEELLCALAIDDTCDRPDRLALFADDLTIHQFTDRYFLQVSGLHLLLLARLHLARLTWLLRLHLLLLRLARLRLGLLCTRRHGNHRRGTEKRCE